jgi:hypothetical protein
MRLSFIWQPIVFGTEKWGGRLNRKMVDLDRDLRKLERKLKLERRRTRFLGYHRQ